MRLVDGAHRRQAPLFAQSEFLCVCVYTRRGKSAATDDEREARRAKRNSLGLGGALRHVDEELLMLNQRFPREVAHKDDELLVDVALVGLRDQLPECANLAEQKKCVC